MAMTHKWLEEQGLLSLEKQWCSIRDPDGPKGSKGEQVANWNRRATDPYGRWCGLTITHKSGHFQSLEIRFACLNISTLISTNCSVIFRMRWYFEIIFLTFPNLPRGIKTVFFSAARLCRSGDVKNEIESGWAEEEFADVDLGDKRRNQRLVHLCGRLSKAPESAINQACEDWSETKAAY
ncbi:MAG: hypothetical protein ACJAQT_002881 [Akkermansiaceae bacterium]|jgi:hypothetical protein